MRLLGIGDSYLIQIQTQLTRLLKPYGIDFFLDGEGPPKSLDHPGLSNIGDTSNALKRLRSDSLLSLPFDAIYFHAGLHDIKCKKGTLARQVPIEQFEANLDSLFHFAKLSKLTILWTTIPKIEDRVHNQLHAVGFDRYNADAIAYNHVAKAVAERYQIPLIDAYRVAFDMKPTDYLDHIHWNEDAAIRYAEGIARQIVDILNQGGTK